MLAVSPRCPPELACKAEWSLQDFVLVKKLGVGGASVVYQGVYRKSGLCAALKMYVKAKMSPLNVHQVQREVAIHIRLDHPNIIQLWGAFEAEDHIVLVVDYAPKGDLFDLLRGTGGRMHEDLVVRQIMWPFMSGLAYLHSNSIIHRDIKLENTLFAADGTLKIADFGLSVDTTSEHPVTRLGTLDYMSPEVMLCPDKRNHQASFTKRMAAPKHTYDDKVDSWACGVLAYELLVGCPPFGMSTREGSVNAILHSEPKLPHLLPASAKDFITRALTKAPEQRPTVAQLMQHEWIRSNLDPLTVHTVSLAHMLHDLKGRPMGAAVDSAGPPLAPPAPRPFTQNPSALPAAVTQLHTHSAGSLASSTSVLGTSAFDALQSRSTFFASSSTASGTGGQQSSLAAPVSHAIDIASGAAPVASAHSAAPVLQLFSAPAAQPVPSVTPLDLRGLSPLAYSSGGAPPAGPSLLDTVASDPAPLFSPASGPGAPVVLPEGPPVAYAGVPSPRLLFGLGQGVPPPEGASGGGAGAAASSTSPRLRAMEREPTSSQRACHGGNDAPWRAAPTTASAFPAAATVDARDIDGSHRSAAATTARPDTVPSGSAPWLAPARTEQLSAIALDYIQAQLQDARRRDGEALPGSAAAEAASIFDRQIALTSPTHAVLQPSPAAMMRNSVDVPRFHAAQGTSAHSMLEVRQLPRCASANINSLVSPISGATAGADYAHRSYWETEGSGFRPGGLVFDSPHADRAVGASGADCQTDTSAPPARPPRPPSPPLASPHSRAGHKRDLVARSQGVLSPRDAAAATRGVDVPVTSPVPAPSRRGHPDALVRPKSALAIARMPCSTQSFPLAPPHDVPDPAHAGLNADAPLVGMSVLGCSPTFVRPVKRPLFHRTMR